MSYRTTVYPVYSTALAPHNIFACAAGQQLLVPEQQFLDLLKRMIVACMIGTTKPTICLTCSFPFRDSLTPLFLGWKECILSRYCFHTIKRGVSLENRHSQDLSSSVGWTCYCIHFLSSPEFSRLATYQVRTTYFCILLLLVPTVPYWTTLLVQ